MAREDNLKPMQPGETRNPPMADQKEARTEAPLHGSGWR